MKKTGHQKLVRDRIPDIIAASGARAVVHTLHAEEYLVALFQKLAEESSELRVASPEKRAEELADMLEILKSLAKSFNIAWPDIERRQGQKRQERGGFEKRVFLEFVEE